MKSAIRRALGTESAPAGLRRQVTAALAAEALVGGAGDAAGAGEGGGGAGGGGGGAGAGGRLAELWRPRTWAVAAVTLVAVGFAVMQVRAFLARPGAPGPASIAAAPVSFPASFAAAIVRTHDHCAKLTDHHFVPGNDPASLRDELTRQEGVQVCAITPGEGWQFKGAGLCRIGNERAAHLLFVRGRETISIFSLPAPESCHDSAYREMVAAHPALGFTAQGALYCVVGSAPSGQLTLSALEPVADRMRSSLGLETACDVDPFVQTASAAAPSAPLANRVR